MEAVTTTCDARKADTAGARPVAVRVLGYVLLAAWAVVVTAGIVTYHSESTFDDLRSAVASGRVTDVEVIGGTGEDFRGFVVLEVRWRDRLLGKATTVVEAHPAGRAADRAARATGATAVLDRSVGEALAAENPEVRVSSSRHRSGFEVTLLWPASGWVGGLLVGAWFGTLWLVPLTRSPRHATAPGWFWIVLLTGPVGAVAFLLASGVLAAHVPTEPRRRLTGGWAFVLATVVGSLATALA